MGVGLLSKKSIYLPVFWGMESLISNDSRSGGKKHGKSYLVSNELLHNLSYKLQTKT